MLRIAEHWYGSDLGRQRQGNEDNYFVRAPLFVVADGMGGAQAGEVASEIAAASFEHGLPDGGTVAEGLARIIEDANRRIHDRSRAEAELAGMGTTVTAAHVGHSEVTIAHVGDSRAYLMRDGEVVRLTRDHSLVNELIERGKLTEEQAETHPQRSVITRALGPEPNVQVDLEAFQARAGDVFLVCSDGLTSMIPESRLAPILTRAGSLEEAGRALIDAANDAGGRDNITVVLFRLEEVSGAGAASGAPASRSDADTSEYSTSDREGLRSGPPAGDESEANYRRQATMAMSAVRPRAEPEEHPPRRERRDPEPAATPKARRRRRVPVGAIVLAVFVFIVAAAFWTASRVVYFVGTDPQHGNAVTIYEGLPYELPLGLKLYSRHTGSGVTLAEIPPARRKTFTDHKLRSLDDAENLVNALETGKLQP
ncbi:MAG TPA: Stp1/IreP family PP2C-type Ser/Thr phosphatase [Solirubrobacteraceae bacterium]|nr:Stp1/IreP family PP2C-type Ser/Thr phosphatase [Solirubrobacteraceae bacterium]